jgi:hypothetical protein
MGFTSRERQQFLEVHRQFWFVSPAVFVAASCRLCWLCAEQAVPSLPVVCCLFPHVHVL